MKQGNALSVTAAAALLLFAGLFTGDGPWAASAGNGVQHRNMQQYRAFCVNTGDDPFVNREQFRLRTGGAEFVDNNGDGICDHIQDTPLYAGLGLGEFVDENGDGICDCFQTVDFYRALGLDNFVDVDGDGICDNYELDPRGPHGPGNVKTRYEFQCYEGFAVDISSDPFVNREQFRLRTGGAEFVDNNGDGICDHIQDTPCYAGLGYGEFVDENDDGICDCFQTVDFYRALGLDNFVDVDGDGICDNYLPRPTGWRGGFCGAGGGN